MRFATLLTLLVLMGGCASAIEHPTSMSHIAWIQTGITTRSQVETRFGRPNFEVPEYAGSTPQSDTPRSDENTPKVTTAVIQSPKDTKATYLHAKSPNVQTQEDRFWVTYDGNNVVKDFGFAGPPTAPTNAPR